MKENKQRFFSSILNSKILLNWSGITIVTSYEIDYSLNLSILLSEGKETNRDFFCSGERTRNCPRFKI
jgi:hypothetical protein